MTHKNLHLGSLLGVIQKLRGQDEVGRWSVKCPWLSTKGVHVDQNPKKLSGICKKKPGPKEKK